MRYYAPSKSAFAYAMYPFLRFLLFQLDAERAHHLVMDRLSAAAAPAQALLTQRYAKRQFDQPTEIMGITFPNRIGMAAGFDKDARHLAALQTLGFGFVEVGTVTPRAQPGNPKPRIFRLPRDKALINRLGFNNDGLDAMRERLEQRPEGLVVGGNIGKNKDTDADEAVNDYVACFRGLHDRVDYFVVNVSSPNTPGLRNLQDREPLTRILGDLQNANQGLSVPKPILLKIAPDLPDLQIVDTVHLVQELGIDGIVACNTTIQRDGLNTQAARLEDIGAGGVSGRPVRQRATEVMTLIRETAGRDMILVGVGGIASADSARERLAAGADLLQIYTGFIYEGPAIVGALKRAIMTA
ncbi:MAG: quinone-dependent dihydroorotate dehydrogenase [Pseudomonadota bacterium]